MDRVFFIDLDGNIIENEQYASHIGLAIYILENNERLNKIYKSSGYNQQDLFLINHVGYIEGYSNDYQQLLIINKDKATKAQKETAFKFVQSGYSYQFSNDDYNLTR